MLSNDLVATVRSIVEGFAGGGGGGAEELDTTAWTALDGAGYLTAGLPGPLGGGGGTFSDAVAVAAGAAACRAPVVEACMVAAPLLANAGLSWPGGVVTVATLDSGEDAAAPGPALSGVLRHVPWLAAADHVVVVDRGHTRPRVCVLDRTGSAMEVTPGANIAGERRDNARLRDAKIVAAAPIDHDYERRIGRYLLPLARAVQMAVMSREVLSLTVEHTTVRQQFGRRLVDHQAVQQSIARMAAEVAMLEAGVHAALKAVDEEPDEVATLVAALRVEGSTVAGLVTSIAHQLHGAIGYTEEHSLGRATRRLWAWRDECGTEAQWRATLLRLLAGRSADPWLAVAGHGSGG